MTSEIPIVLTPKQLQVHRIRPVLAGWHSEIRIVETVARTCRDFTVHDEPILPHSRFGY